jgi:ABC-2 type transport system permease protein
MASIAQARTPGAGRYGFRHAARMEWIKLRSLRSTTWVLAAGVAISIALGAVAGFNTRNPHGDPTSNILAGIAFGQVVFGVLGVLTMTGEYSSGMIRATLAAIPRRPLVLAAKAATYGLVALAAGEITTFGSFLGGTAVLHASVPHPALSQPTVLRAVTMTGAYLALAGLMGLGLGAIIRHSAAAVATLIGGLFVLTPLVAADTHKGGQFLPELIVANSLSAVKPVRPFTLSPWIELGIVAAYAAALLGAGSWSLVRRDA